MGVPKSKGVCRLGTPLRPTAAAHLASASQLKCWLSARTGGATRSAPAMCVFSHFSPPGRFPMLLIRGLRLCGCIRRVLHTLTYSLCLKHAPQRLSEPPLTRSHTHRCADGDVCVCLSRVRNSGVQRRLASSFSLPHVTGCHPCTASVSARCRKTLTRPDLLSSMSQLAKFKGLDGRTRWSAPSAFAFGGGGGGFDFGGARSDILLILNSDGARLLRTEMPAHSSTLPTPCLIARFTPHHCSSNQPSIPPHSPSLSAPQSRCKCLRGPT